ncbi:hypothetical protein ABTH94_21955, partial [Acinetobacter baumannii]
AEDALRAAQTRANEQRTLVAQVQQQIQVLAAESRSVDEQARALRQREDRLTAESRALGAPDQAALEALRERSAAADEARE